MVGWWNGDESRMGGLRVAVNHPSDKNKNVARMGHPQFVSGELTGEK
jgi:hypothetical protein